MVTPDLPGHGARPPAPAGVTLADLADGVAADIPPGSHLVGFSLGALVAQHLALHRPALVATLTSVSSVCRRTAEERAAVLDRLRTAERDFAASAAASLRRWYDGTDVDPEQVRRTEATLLANDRDSFLHCYRVFATADAELGPELDRITVPALAITGECDPGSTPEMTRRLADGIARLPSGHRARRTPHAPRPTAAGVRRLPVHLHRSEHTCLTTRNCSTSSAASGSPRRRASTSRAPTRPPARCSTTPLAATPPTSSAAVDSAQATFEDPRWRDLSQTRRGHLLRRLGDLIGEHAEELARSESQDNGKLLREMRGQLTTLPEYYYYYAGLADKIHGRRRSRPQTARC